jgi:uncharacterized protein YdiU (UPF0061 family)
MTVPEREPTPIVFDNSYVHLPKRFHERTEPTPVAAPTRIRVNRDLATSLGIDLDWLESEEATSTFAGNFVPVGAEPLAAAYAGHQFGGFNPQLGDGRAVLLGEVIDGTGARFDLQLKGAGETAYSRSGDGRSPLGPVLREYVVSEAMHTLGVPSTRALAAVGTGETVFREQPLPGAVLTRVARSHIRIGTFEYFAARGDEEALRVLTRYTLERHFPELVDADRPALALLEGVVARQAALVSQWKLLGFIHGVMNTDNMLVSGETIDYGPCAFMEAYHPNTVFSSIDRGGRYAYANQEKIARWNLLRFAEALLLIMRPTPEEAVPAAQDAVDRFDELHLAADVAGRRQKLGLEASEPGDEELFSDLLELMAKHETDFTLSFRRLAELAASRSLGQASVSSFYEFPEAFDPWLERWRRRLADEARPDSERQSAMLRANPVFIPRNHLVEEAIAAGTIAGDLAPFHRLVDRLANPWSFDDADERYARPATPEQRVHRTFCGT